MRFKGSGEEKLGPKLIMAQLPKKMQITPRLPQTPAGTHTIHNSAPPQSTEGMQAWSLFLGRSWLFRNRFGKVIFGT